MNRTAAPPTSPPLIAMAVVEDAEQSLLCRILESVGYIIEQLLILYSYLVF